MPDATNQFEPPKNLPNGWTGAIMTILDTLQRHYGPLGVMCAILLFGIWRFDVANRENLVLQRTQFLDSLKEQRGDFTNSLDRLGKQFETSLDRIERRGLANKPF